MSERRFFVAPENIDGDTITITGQDVAHITRVLRLRPGDKLSLSNGVNRLYNVDISQVNRDNIACKVTYSREYVQDVRRLFVYQGLPKGKKMDLIVEKLTEVGVDGIVPVAMARSVAEYSGDRGRIKVERWRVIALEAAKQSRRITVPIVKDVTNWTAAVEEMGAAAILLVPWEDERTATVRQALQTLSSDAIGKDTPTRDIALVIGPEGGFSATEIDELKAAGAVTVTLGPTILRTETAGIVAVALALDALRQ